MDKREIFTQLEGCSMPEPLVKLTEAEEALNYEMKKISEEDLRENLDEIIGVLEFESAYKGFLLALHIQDLLGA